MSFSKSGTIVSQDSGTTNTGLARSAAGVTDGLEDISGVTKTYEGEIAVYTFTAGDRFDIKGTLTIDPEVERINMRTSIFLIITTTGRLNLGVDVTENGSTRGTVGVAICNSIGQRIWSGANSGTSDDRNGFLIEGEMNWLSGTIQGPTHFHLQTTGSLYIRDGIWASQDVSAGTIDPQTGVTVTGGAGTNQTGVAQVLIANRGYIGYFFGSDYRVDNFTQLGGGEMTTSIQPTGTNSITGTANGIFGYNSNQAVVGIFPRTEGTSGVFTFTNTAVGDSGNVKDFAIFTLSGGGGSTDHTVSEIVNEASGTLIKCIGAESPKDDRRQRASCSIFRNMNFNITDGITGTAIEGGRFYMIDTNNTNRQTGVFNSLQQGVNYISDEVYSDVFVAGASTEQKVLLGSVQVFGTGSSSPGYVILGNTDNSVTQGTNFTEGTTPDSRTNLAAWRMDLRGKNNTLGDDKFDFHVWRYENQYLPLLNSELTDGTTGTLVLSPRVVTDSNITNTRATIDALNTSIGSNFVVNSSGITTGSTSVNLDQVYDLVKYKKETSAANLIIPSSSTLIISSDGTELDLGTRTITQGSGLWTVGSTHNKVSHDTLLDLSKFTLAGGIELTAPTLNNLPASIGTSILNPTNTIAGTGGHTSVSTSVINGDVDITGSSSNILGGSITGALDLKGGDTDFNGSVDEVGGITTGNITLGSTSLRTIDFKAGSTTKGTISASTVTNLVLDGTHEKAVTRSVGTATTSADGSIAGILTLGNGVLTSGSTFVCDETVTAGNGDHSVAGTIAKKLTLGNGDSTINATVSSGGLDLGTGDQTINGNITGAVATDGTLTTGSTFIASSTVTASTATGDQSIDGTIAGDVTLGAATSGHTIDGALSSKLIMGTGAHTINGTVTSTINTTGTLTTGLVYSGGSTVAASGIGDSTIRGTTTGLLTLGNATVGHTLNGTFTGGFTIGTGASSFDGTAAADSQAGNGNFSFNGALTGDFTHGTGTLIFGPSASMTGTLTKSGPSAANGLTLTTDQASTIDLVVTTGTLELFGAVRNDYNSVTGLTNDNAIPTTTTFQVGSGLPSGRVIFRERSAAAGTHLIDSTHTEGATTTLGVINNNSGSPTNYDIYYKPTNTFGDDGVFWAVTVVNSDNGATTNRTIDVTSTPHAGVLTRAAEDADLTGLTATMDAITTGTTGNINITGATTQIDAPQTQALMLRVTDDANYLNLLANTNAEMDDILPGIQSGSSINQSRLTLQATNQQSITALAGTGTGTLIGTITVGGLTFAAVFIFPNPSGLSGPEAQVACEAAIDGRAVSGQSIQTAVTDCLKRGDLTEIGQE